MTFEEQVSKNMASIEEDIVNIKSDMASLTRQVSDGFSKNALKLQEIATGITVSNAQQQVAQNELFVKKNELDQMAFMMLDHPEYRKKASTIVDDWMESEHGEMVMERCFIRSMEAQRDRASKWIAFLKLLSGFLVAISLFYASTSIIDAQKQNYKQLIKIEKSIGE